MKNVALAFAASLAVASTAQAGSLNVMTTPLALSKIQGMHVQEVNYTNKNGQTMVIRLFSHTPEQQKRMEDIANKIRKQMEQRLQVDDGERARYAGNPDLTGGFNGDTSSIYPWIEAACVMISWAAYVQGGLNIYFDAVGALCAAVTIVDAGQQIGNQIYAGYEASIRLNNIMSTAAHTAIWAIPGGLPIY